MMRRGRKPAITYLTRRDRKMWCVCAVTVSLLLTIKAAAFVEQQQTLRDDSVNKGQPITLEDFPGRRSYIRYRINRSGNYNWLSAIAQRFQVSGWKKIARATLHTGSTEPGETEINRFQYEVHLGSELRIPLP